MIFLRKLALATIALLSIAAASAKEIYEGTLFSVYQTIAFGGPSDSVYVAAFAAADSDTFSISLVTDAAGLFSGFDSDSESVTGSVTETQIQINYPARGRSFTLTRTPFFGPVQGTQGQWRGTVFDNSVNSGTEVLFVGSNSGKVILAAQGFRTAIGVGTINSNGDLFLQFGSQTTTGNLKFKNGKLTGNINFNGYYTISSITLSNDNPAVLQNVSTRGFVGSGDARMIAGFVVADGSKGMMIRVLGSSLSSAGVSGTLADPYMEIYDSANKLITTNDDWASAPTFNKIPSDRAPKNAKECGLILTLVPGAYTVVVSGVGGTTGVVIVEAYEVR